jgi:hypothetical protein
VSFEWRAQAVGMDTASVGGGAAVQRVGAGSVQKNRAVPFRLDGRAW